MLAGTGLLWAVDGLMESWTAYSHAHDLPGTNLAATVVDRVGAFLLLGAGYYAYTYATMGRFTNMSVLLFSAAVIVFLIGLISEQITSLTYQAVRGERRSDDKPGG